MKVEAPGSGSSAINLFCGSEEPLSCFRGHRYCHAHQEVLQITNSALPQASASDIHVLSLWVCKRLPLETSWSVTQGSAALAGC